MYLLLLSPPSSILPYPVHIYTVGTTSPEGENGEHGTCPSQQHASTSKTLNKELFGDYVQPCWASFIRAPSSSMARA